MVTVKQEKLRRGTDGNILGNDDYPDILVREREMVNSAMENKLTDSLGEGVEKKIELSNLKRRLWWRLRREVEKRRLSKKLRDMVNTERSYFNRACSWCGMTIFTNTNHCIIK